MLCLASLCLSLSHAQEPFQLLKDSRRWGGDATTMLVLRTQAGYLERFAADEFAAYLHRASKSRMLLPRAIGDVPPGWEGSAIFLGVAGQPPFADVAPESLPMNGFRIRTGPARLDLIGASEQGASNALYWLLREKVGVRWYMPTRLGEEVPVHEEITLEPMDLVAGPDIPAGTFDVHYYGASGNRSAGGQPRDFYGRHYWSDVVRPSDKNRQQHPEWFALTDREQLPAEDWKNWLWTDAEGHIRSNQVCTTNPEVIAQFVVAATAYFRTNPDASTFPIDPNDYSDFCTCERCLKLDHDLGDGPLMNRLTLFFNEIAARLKPDFPNKHLGFYAYASHTRPPTTVKPDPMLTPALCFFGSPACYAHAIADPDCPINSTWKQSVFDPWTKLCDRFGYYAYYAYSGNWQGPQLMVRTLPEDLKLMHEHGCFYFNVSGPRHYATSAPMQYLARRLLWDVDADPAAILDEWYTGTYGPAYEPMKAYWETLIRGYYQGTHHGSKPDRPQDMFTPGIMAEAQSHLEAAEQAVASAPDRYQRRVAIARAGFQYTEPMTRGYGHAANGEWQQAIAAGEQALQAIVQSRAIEPAPYVTPLWPRDEQTWVWYRSWDGSRSSEIMTSSIIDGWREQSAQAPPAGQLVLELPEQWSFRKDEAGQGEQQKWFDLDITPTDWQPVSTHMSWTTQAYPGDWHGTGWYRLDFTLPEAGPGPLVVRFGAVDGRAKVWLNGTLVAERSDEPGLVWNKPWSVDITDAARAGQVNRLAVSVTKQEFAAGIWRPTEIRRMD